MIATDIIKIQLSNLINCHEYRIEYKLHYTQTQYDGASLDKDTFIFKASKTTQNAFVLLSKDTRITNLLLEVNAFDITDGNALSYSQFITCPGYNICNPPTPIV